jgi:hypothetical protein
LTQAPSDEPIIVTVPRDAVVSCDIEPVLMGLSVFVRSSALAPQAQGKLELLFDGFNDDKRELWQIPEVRRFVARLDAVFPYWFFLADLRTETLHLLASCLCRSSELAPGLTGFNQEDLLGFLQRQFDGLNELWELHGLAPGNNVVVTERIVEYFASRRVMN